MKEIRKELLDELLAEYEKPEDLLGREGLLDSLKKALMERALGAELTEHLGYEKGDPTGRGSRNSRNGHGRKRLAQDHQDPVAFPQRPGRLEAAVSGIEEHREGVESRAEGMVTRSQSKNT